MLDRDHQQVDTTAVIYMGTFCPPAAAMAYRSLASLFEARGYSVSIKAIPKLGLGRIDEAARQLADEVFHTSRAERYVLVGHSQGALIALYHARRYPSLVEAVFGFGGPFHGTWLANLGRLSRLPAVRTMAAHSRFLRELREDSSYEAENIHSLYSVFDELVVPWFASTVSGANNVVLAPARLHPLLVRLGLTRSRGIELVDGWADHLGVIWHPALHRQVDLALDRLETDRLVLAA
ncbi:hypothetical protein IT414_02230 [bacterium]|nr:hypothetical protein [bacterium]